MAPATLFEQSTAPIHNLKTTANDPYYDYDHKLQDYIAQVEKHKPLFEQEAKNVETSGPQGKIRPLTIVDDASAWTAESLKGKEAEYTYTLSKADVAEITAAVDKIKSRIPATEEAVKQLTKEDYELPNFGPKLIELVKNVSLGRGFQLLKGFPVEQYKEDRFGQVVAFWGLALVLGVPQISQTDYNKKGETFGAKLYLGDLYMTCAGSLLNHVTVGRFTSVGSSDVYPENAKGNHVSKPVHPQFKPFDERRLEFHSDQGATDLIALLSLSKAKEGGESKWVSAVAIHNELLRQGRKDLVEALSQRGAFLVPKKHDQRTYKRNQDGSFEGFEDDPPFVYHDGYLSSHYAATNYQEIDLTPIQQEAVWTFAAIAEDPKFHLAKTFEPGDIEIISNQTILHSRGDIYDGETPEEKRHLLRWWVAQPKERNPRGIIPTFAPRSNVLPEGGFVFPGKELRLPFYPYARHDGQGQSEW